MRLACPFGLGSLARWAASKNNRCFFHAFGSLLKYRRSEVEDLLVDKPAVISCFRGSCEVFGGTSSLLLRVFGLLLLLSAAKWRPQVQRRRPR